MNKIKITCIDDIGKYLEDKNRDERESTMEFIADYLETDLVIDNYTRLMFTESIREYMKYAKENHKSI